MKFTTQQLNTVLAALRLWQQNLPHQHEFIDQGLVDIATDNGAHKQLDAEEIDQLCEDLNFEECEDDEGAVFCSVCGEDHQRPVCNDEFPEAGQIRETGK